MKTQNPTRSEDHAELRSFQIERCPSASAEQASAIRHPKITRAGVAKLDSSGVQIGSPEHELRRLLLLAGFPEPMFVESVTGTSLGEQEVAWR